MKKIICENCLLEEAVALGCFDTIGFDPDAQWKFVCKNCSHEMCGCDITIQITEINTKEKLWETWKDLTEHPWFHCLSKASFLDALKKYDFSFGEHKKEYIENTYGKKF